MTPVHTILKSNKCLLSCVPAGWQSISQTGAWSLPHPFRAIAPPQSGRDSWRQPRRGHRGSDAPRWPRVSSVPAPHRSLCELGPGGHRRTGRPSRPRVPGPTHPSRPAMLACLPPMRQCSLSGRFSLIVLFKRNVIITWLGVTFSMFLLRGSLSSVFCSCLFELWVYRVRPVPSPHTSGLTSQNYRAAFTARSSPVGSHLGQFCSAVTLLPCRLSCHESHPVSFHARCCVFIS